MEYTMECGTIANTGDRVYNYYDMEPGVIGKDYGSAPHRQDGWFEFIGDGHGGPTILNGQRVCSIAFAKRRGFPGV